MSPTGSLDPAAECRDVDAVALSMLSDAIENIVSCNVIVLVFVG